MITNIAISNFKSIFELPSLQFGQQVNFLIGKNGVGKSNLLSAIELTRRLCAGQNLESATEPVAPFGSELFTRDSNKSNASITMGVRDQDGTRYELIYSIGLSDSTLIVTDEQLSVISDNDSRPIYIRKADSFKASAKKGEPLVDIPLTVKPDELAISSFSDATAAKVARLISSFKVLWFDKSSTPYAWRVHRRETLDVSNLDGLVISLHETNRTAFNKAVAVIKQIIPEFVAPRVSRISPPNSKSNTEEDGKTLDRFIVFWGEKDIHEIEYTLSGLSDGNFRVIQLIFALFDSQSSACLIGEEIENGQHYGRIKTLIEVLKHLAIKLNVQLIFSTHSGELLGHVSANDVIFCTKNEQGYSSYQKLSEAIDTGMVTKELGHEPTAREFIDLGMV